MKVKHLIALLAVLVIAVSAHAFNFAFTQTPKSLQLLSSITGGSSEHKLKEPAYAIADQAGKVYVADAGNHSVKVFDRQGSYLYEFSKTKAKEQLVYPYGIGILTRNRIVVADPGAGALYEYNSQGEYLSTWLEPRQKAQPAAVFVTDGKVYVTDLTSRQILVFNDRGKLLRKIKPQKVELGSPLGVAVNKDGTLWVADGSNYNLKLLGENGEIKTIFDGGPKNSLSMAKGLTVDRQGRIFVADTLSNTIRVFDQTGKDLFSLGAQEDQQSQFLLPLGLSIDNDGKLYVADQGNNRIQIWCWQ